MPIYEYICKDCNRKFEMMRAFSDADKETKCDRCGSVNTQRTVSKCFAKAGEGSTFSTTIGGGGCGGCSGGDCSHCHH